MRIAVLGGGVAGTVMCRGLAEHVDGGVVLYEREDRLGGLHRSIEFGGLHYDIGCFLFDPNHALLQTFPFLYDHFVKVDHRSRVLTRHGTLDTYPMTMTGYLRDNSLLSVAADALSLLRSKVRDRERDTLRKYVQYYLGPRIYRKSGLKTYIERFSGRPDTEVDLEFALQRLDGLPEACGLRRNGLRLIRDAFDQSVAEQTWGCYVRPADGFPTVYSMIEDDLRGRGVSVRLGSAIRSVERVDGGKFLVDEGSGKAEAFDLVVSTLPPGIMMRLIGEPMRRPPRTLRLVSLCYRFRGRLAFAGAGMFYNFTEDARWKRITLFSSQYGTVDGDEYFTVECTLPEEDPTTPEELREDFERHAGSLPIFDGTLHYQGTILTPHAYPVLTPDDLQQNASAAEHLCAFGIVLTGRQASYRHATSHAIATGARALAEKIGAGVAGGTT